MPQNKYDDPAFFAAYSAMPRSTGGLGAALEWPVLCALLPDLRGKRVLDIGCGFGWHCRWARGQGAASVLGIDVSERMLARAVEATADPAIAYRRGAIEDMALPAGSFDLVLSSLALHYVEHFDPVCRRVAECLVAGGSFVLSVEHPVFTARAEQDWWRSEDGTPLHWPVDGYQHEGLRRTAWLAEDVVKYHRTLASWINGLIDAGFRIDRLAEPGPPEAAIADRPELRHELRRPMFLMISATKAR
ncbi:MAG TPA: class I SAM-dependent methyltransferase [Geminicoccaceae bacterium]|nr:class I SAM-dependent methyltransferase [Geminicoccus sp.]HMU48718.1 class I SAM-dependent methyltransferase [Geminicoccaceae bacterium]